MERDDPIGGSSRGGGQPSGESSATADDRERLYAAVSEEIGAGFARRNWRGGTQSRQQVTPFVIFAAALMSVSVVVIAFAVYPFAFSALLGDPFVYTNLPFPVCMPDPQAQSNSCTQPLDSYAFTPGQPVPMLFGRCYHNPLAGGGEAVYTVHRRLVSDQNGVQIQIGDSFSTTRAGCTLERESTLAVPPETPPGRYHFEGFVEIHAWREENVPWRSTSFQVESGGN